MFRRGGGGTHFRYVYNWWGEEVIRVKNPPPENSYREFGPFCVKTMTSWGRTGEYVIPRSEFL